MLGEVIVIRNARAIPLKKGDRSFKYVKIGEGTAAAAATAVNSLERPSLLLDIPTHDFSSKTFVSSFSPSSHDPGSEPQLKTMAEEMMCGHSDNLSITTRRHLSVERL